MNKHQIDLMVVSCDSYSDVWPYFFDNFFNFWQNCPLEIYLLSNNKTFSSTKINQMKIGSDVSWSDNLINGLKNLNNNYVLLLIDDLIINRRVSNNYFNNISDWVNINNPNYLKLKKTRYSINNDSLSCKIPKFSLYKTSVLPSIWKVETLIRLLKKGESAWDFEIAGTKRAFSYDNFFSLRKDFIYYENSIIKGKWQRSIHSKIKNKFGDSSRPAMNLYEQSIYDLKVFRSFVFNLLPNEIKLRLKK